MPHYNLPIDDNVYARIKQLAEAEDRSIGYMLRKLLNEALDRREASK